MHESCCYGAHDWKVLMSCQWNIFIEKRPFAKRYLRRQKLTDASPLTSKSPCVMVWLWHQLGYLFFLLDITSSRRPVGQMVVKKGVARALDGKVRRLPQFSAICVHHHRIVAAANKECASQIRHFLGKKNQILVTSNGSLRIFDNRGPTYSVTSRFHKTFTVTVTETRFHAISTKDSTVLETVTYLIKPNNWGLLVFLFCRERGSAQSVRNFRTPERIRRSECWFAGSRTFSLDPVKIASLFHYSNVH